jgi:acetyl-CoA carboxylase carboxyl transferase subunit beta
MASRIDVSIEHKNSPPEPGGSKKHPNTCPKCNSHYRDDELAANLRVCAQCDYHFPVGALERIEQLLDKDSFIEEAADLRSADPLGFFDLRSYKDRIAEAELKTGLGDAMLMGQGKIEGLDFQLTVMDFSFMAGSMGSVVGEKFAQACERAIERKVPLISVNASGGARMQEGILSLMQVPKTVCAVENMRDAGIPFISVLTHPTTAGLLASFATLGDITIAEPGR